MASIPSNFSTVFGNDRKKFVAAANEFHLRFRPGNDVSIQYLDAVYNGIVCPVSFDIFAAQSAFFGAIDDGFHIVAAGCDNFGGITGLLFDVLDGIIRVDFASNNSAQTFVEDLPGFMINASISFQIFRIGVAIALDNLNGSRYGTRAGNIFYAFCFSFSSVFFNTTAAIGIAACYAISLSADCVG